MSYAYYPGCSAKGTGRSYEESLRAVFEALGTGLDELEDWNCCGASGYPAVDMAKAVALSARNLALAEGARPGPAPVNVIAPCAGCYRALLKTKRHSPTAGPWPLVSAGRWGSRLHYEGRARPRHPLDVLVNDIGLDRIAEAAVQPFRGLRVAVITAACSCARTPRSTTAAPPRRWSGCWRRPAPSPSTGRCGHAAAAAHAIAAGR